jgi:hypothetical protein
MTYDPTSAYINCDGVTENSVIHTDPCSGLIYVDSGFFLLFYVDDGIFRHPYIVGLRHAWLL